MSLRQYFYDKIWKLDEEPKSKILMPTTDRHIASTNMSEGLEPETLRKVALADPLVLKAIRKKTRDTFRNWIELKPDDENSKVPDRIQKLVFNFDKSTMFKQKLETAGQSSYIYGTGFIERTFTGDERTPVHVAPSKESHDSGLHLLSSENIRKMDYRNSSDKNLYWVYKKGTGENTFIHPERILDVSIDKLPEKTLGNSVINTLRKILESKLNIDESTGQIMSWFGHGILTMQIQGMNETQQKKMMEYFKTHPDYYVYDEDYNLDVKNPTRIDPKPFYDYLYVNIASALVMPTHILTGLEGKNVTGTEVGVMDYYHDIENIQQMVFSPIIEKVYKHLVESYGYNWKYHVKWNPIYVDELSEAKTLQIRSYSAAQLKNATIIDTVESRKIINEGLVKLDPDKKIKEEKPPVPVVKPNIEPQPPVKEKKLMLIPLNEEQKKMIEEAAKREKKLGEEVLEEQEKLFGRKKQPSRRKKK